jgi:perosamine synthetase
VSTGESILYVGAKPVFVDVEPSTKNLDPAKLEQALGPKTKAIVTVSIAGHPCRAAEIGAIARARRIPVIEDAAHSLTARIGDTPVGTQADITCFSFYATKGVTAGEGGMLVTANEEWAARVRRLCLHGLSDAAWSRYGKGGWWEYDVTELGYKYNLTDIQAALALAQMTRAEAMRARRDAIARRYHEALGAFPALHVPEVAPGVRHAWHLYQIARERWAWGRGSSPSRSVASRRLSPFRSIPICPTPTSIASWNESARTGAGRARARGHHGR